jgi:hypothetical protein
MTFEEAALVACVVFSGLWAGLLAMLTLVMHPMLRAMSARYFALNWIRFAATLAAFGLFLAALTTV